jgi:hypothetical protein
MTKPSTPSTARPVSENGRFSAEGQPARVIKHGHNAGYEAGCRERCCRQAHAAYKTHRRRMIAYRQWRPYVDAGPVREHLIRLQAAGLSLSQIAEIAGRHPRTLGYVLYGDPGRRDGPQQRVRADVAEAVLAISLHDPLRKLPVSGYLDGTGTRRRLRALVAIGWSLPQLAERVGGHRKWLQRVVTTDVQVHADTAHAVRQLYERLWNMPGPSQRARAWARERGWAPPMAWDEDALDRPDARPAEAPRANRRGRDRYALWESSEEMLAQGVPLEVVAERLEVSVAALKRARDRVEATRRREREKKGAGPR